MRASVSDPDQAAMESICSEQTQDLLCPRYACKFFDQRITPVAALSAV